MHKIPAHLIGSDSQRIETHQLMTAHGFVTDAEAREAKSFLENRAKNLGLRLAGQWSFENGEVRVWAHVEKPTDTNQFQ